MGGAVGMPKFEGNDGRSGSPEAFTSIDMRRIAAKLLSS